MKDAIIKKIYTKDGNSVESKVEKNASGIESARNTVVTPISIINSINSALKININTEPSNAMLSAASKDRSESQDQLKVGSDANISSSNPI